jgi:uncharacterized membrane protein
MRYLLLAALAVALAGAVHAQAASCKAAAGEKNLHGAALASFMKKCQADATTACKVTATGNKLSGAAKTSFTTKCVRDKVGN